MPKFFLDALTSGRVLLMDGAMGTELQRRGVSAGECYELWNVTHPEAVRAIHRSYVNAGARILLTNSFQANAAALRKHGLVKRLNELSTAAVRLARDAGGAGRFVLADIGPWKTPDATDVAAVAHSLKDADGWLFETWSDRQVFNDVRVAKELDAAKPVLVSIAFRKTGSGCEILTYDNLRPEACAGLAEESGCDALGVNCGNHITLADVLQIVRRYQSVTKLPLFVRPNAGTPTRAGDRLVYPVTPAEMAARLPELLDVGIAMIGGCCGTTPEHIAAMRPIVDGWNA